MSRIPRRFWFWLRLSVAVVVMLWLFTSFDWLTLRQQVFQIDVGWALLGLVIPLFGILLSALKWQGVLRLLGVERSYAELLGHYWSGTFYNNVLPGSIGGDVVRIGGLKTTGVSFFTATLSVFIDRITGIWVGMLIGLGACLWPSELPHRDVLGFAFGTLVLGGIVAVWLLPKLHDMLPQRWQRYGTLATTLQDRRWLPTLAMAWLFQSLVVLHLWVALYALQSPLSLLACAIYAQAVVVVTLVPISLNGIGVRETALVVLLAGSQVAPEVAALAGSMMYLTAVLSSLPGGLALLSVRGDRHTSYE
ncbi:lysylphosphatidylglycerol synthase transmembrane domain-containing protein [Candidatus Viridilinea mediisalina]|uniref:TIGR00374 family protein n=1 Tax=Candidatus Viridilinea mediisalina TaxID=2024553 RepID=A0A2A6RK19_9CHLR|nr:lysylphosphatidylglycerol synthase transmembrane domain-containing protein [Candidatus Viridilinea mediisalina]PDW03236.1 hypothetical protein CJ255_09965 [Candidatus Viridilinea mediisalina]